ncbi:hypothetical protein N9E56_02065 [Flavobacteriaceae bacterium]|nr:hypothetical protein [Flavobacteriaceae bacterium]
MEKRDYLMRLISIFMNALNRIINCIDLDDIENAKIQINEAYALLDADSSYFLNNSLDNIIVFFKTKEGDYLKRIQMLSQLLYCDSLVQDENFMKQQKLKKAIALLEYQNLYSEEYSLELNNQLSQMKNMLIKIDTKKLNL